MAQSVAQLPCNSRSSNPNANGTAVAEGQIRMALGAIESCLALPLPMLAPSKWSPSSCKAPVAPRHRSTAQLRARGRRYGSFAPGARHRFRLVPGDSVGGAVTLQLALDRLELADNVVPQFDHPRGAKDDSPMMRVGP